MVQIYVPNWAEWAPSIAIIAYGFLILSLAYRYLPVFPQEIALTYPETQESGATA